MTQRVFITGGASGLGKSLATQFMQLGWQVAIGDVQDEAGRALVDEWGEPHLYFHCDVTDIHQIEQVRDGLVSHWGGIDLVINNAGVAGAGSFGDISWQDWQWLLSIDLNGVIAGCHVFVEQFKQQGHGHIVNIASMAGLMNMPYMSHYNVAKAGVVALSETLRFELEPLNIHTSVVCPSFFATGLADTMRSPDPQFVNTTRKLFKRSKLSSDQVAEKIVQGIKQKQFWILPHSDGRLMWRIKRYLPFIFSRLVRKATSKVFGFKHKTQTGQESAS